MQDFVGKCLQHKNFYQEIAEVETSENHKSQNKITHKNLTTSQCKRTWFIYSRFLYTAFINQGNSNTEEQKAEFDGKTWQGIPRMLHLNNWNGISSNVWEWNDQCNF